MKYYNWNERSDEQKLIDAERWAQDRKNGLHSRGTSSSDAEDSPDDESLGLEVARVFTPAQSSLFTAEGVRVVRSQMAIEESIRKQNEDDAARRKKEGKGCKGTPKGGKSTKGEEKREDSL